MFVNEEYRQKFYFYFIQPLKVKLMKKTYKLMMVSLLFGALTYAQVGVGTATPSAGLDIVSQGNTNATKALEVNNATNTEMVTVLDNGNVGIGNTTPATKLDINNGTTVGAIKIVDGTQGAGRVLTSDANGVGTWSPTPATALYFLSTSTGNGSPEFAGTNNPVPGSPNPGGSASTTTRYLINGSTGIRNLGPATAFTSGTTGISYTVPQNGMYRITLYTDYGQAGARIGMAAYRTTSQIRLNLDNVAAAAAATMINLWELQAGDIVVPVSTGSVPNNGQLVETTFTVERVN